MVSLLWRTQAAQLLSTDAYALRTFVKMFLPNAVCFSCGTEPTVNVEDTVICEAIGRQKQGGVRDREAVRRDVVDRADVMTAPVEWVPRRRRIGRGGASDDV